jgi:hypothetical protein
MKKVLLIPALFCFAPIAFAFSADARSGGCLKGAIVGDSWPRRGAWWNWSAAGCAYGMHGGPPTIAKMGTMATLATNSVVETASTGAIE